MINGPYYGENEAFLKKKPHIGQILVERKVITPKQLQEALDHQKSHGGLLLGQIFIHLGFVSEEELAIAMTSLYHLPYLPLHHYEIDGWAVDLIPQEMAKENLIIPIERMGNSLTVVIADPSNTQALEKIRQITHCEILLLVSTASDIRTMIDLYYNSQAGRHERRNEPRFNRQLPLIVADETQVVKSHTRDISATGISCLLTKPFRQSAKVDIFLSMPSEPHPNLIKSRGTVVWIRPIPVAPEIGWNYQTGICMSDLSEENRSKIRQFLEIAA